MYQPCSGPAFSAAGGERWNVFALPQEQFPIHHSWGLRERSQVRRFVNQSLRVPCEWMQRRMDAAWRGEEALARRPVAVGPAWHRERARIWGTRFRCGRREENQMSPPALRERRHTADREVGGKRLLDEEQPRLEIAGQSPHSFPQLKAEKNVGKALSVYWQQPPSQQAGLSQQVATDAACADNEMKKTAANANTSALSFIMISFWKMLHDRHTRASCVFDVRAIEKQKERKMSA
jgi:hypothetical protein